MFERHTVYNVVGHGNVGTKLDLAALCKANPDIIWIYDSFPAAKCKVWLTADCRCHCPLKKVTAADEVLDEAEAKALKLLHKKKCPCTAKALIFETGKVVIIGAQSPDDVYAVFERLLEFGQDYKRIGSIVVSSAPIVAAAAAVPITGTKAMSITDAIALLYECTRRIKNKRHRTMPKPTLLSPLMQLCDAGRVEQVRITLAMNPTKESVDGALERMLALEQRSEDQEQIVAMLSVKSPDVG